MLGHTELLGHTEVCSPTQEGTHTRLGEGGEIQRYQHIRPTYTVDSQPSSTETDHSGTDPTHNCIHQDWQKGWTPFQEGRDRQE